MKNKNLLILCPSFPDKSNQFYWWIFVKEYINSIKEFFNKIYVISPIPSIYLIKTNKEKICKNYTYDNVEVFFPKHFHLPIKYFRERLWDNQFKVVDDLVQKSNLQFDVIHAHFTWPSWYIWVKLKKKYWKKIIVTWHWYDVYDLPFRNDYWKEIIINILKKSDIITTVSKSNADKLNLLWFNDINVIPNWYNDKIFKFIDNKINLKKELNISLDKKILLNVWNLVTVKNQKTLILACKELLKIRDDFICYIIWGWFLKNELQSLINKNNLQDYVKLLWQKKSEEVAKYMNTADLFVFPSLSESFWIVQIEAMACWIPIVTTINWGSEEIIISEDYWFLIKEKNNPKLLSWKINEWLKKKWDKEKIVNYAKNNFSYEKFLNTYIKLYENNTFT